MGRPSRSTELQLPTLTPLLFHTKEEHSQLREMYGSD